jgi:prepilin-type N-terminal cleavage/methylation domain-containing protein
MRTESRIANRACAAEAAATATRRRESGGFTLLEVLIAMCVLLISIAAILPLFAVGTASHKRGMDQTIVSLLAPHITAKIQENLTAPDPKDLKDAELQYHGLTYRYDAQFAPFDGADPARTAFIVRVTIRWKEGGQDRAEAFDTILLRRMKR